jgi:hypothetical protein
MLVLLVSFALLSRALPLAVIFFAPLTGRVFAFVPVVFGLR